MIAGETLSILKSQENYDSFFRKKKKKRSKAARKAKRRKFWKGVGEALKGIGGFQGVGSTLDAVTGMNQNPPKPIRIPPIHSNGVQFQIGEDSSDNEIDIEKEKKHKKNKEMGMLIGGVVLLIVIIGGGIYLHKKAMNKKALTSV